jgi:diguanylate cyclase (GGDEF)-like protein/PAS domain S-box-containing protein
MADRAELMEAALDVYPEGLALLDETERVIFWNHAAEILTGYPNASMIGRPLPEGLDPITSCALFERSEPGCGPLLGRGTLVHAQHKQGHDIPAITRRVVLRDPLGGRIGTAAVFHLAEHAAALPHGETSEGSEVRASQAELRDHLETEHERFAQQGAAMGILWITVDQAENMRKTHGARACEAMLENVERTLANHLRTGDEVGRWGDEEFLVLSHEPSGKVLSNQAQVLAGLARTADFRWWGDRLTLTVSIGAAEAEPGEELADVLKRARAAMEASVHAGGNRVTLAPGRLACSLS